MAARIRPLPPADMEVLEFERARWGVKPGPKESLAAERFGITGGRPLARYHQILNRILDDPAAEVYDPELVRRLRRIRDQHRANRTTPRRAS